jgi:hypothetical protein
VGVLPGWVAGVALTGLLSIISAWGFLLARCRGVGRPFGPTSKWWAVAVVLITGAAASVLGVAGAAAGHHVRAFYIGLAVPSALWFDKAAKQRGSREGSGNSWLPEALVVWLTFFIQRMTDRIGDDLETWCDERLSAVSGDPRILRQAAVYYHRHIVVRFLRNDVHRKDFDVALEAILHKLDVINLISLDTTAERLNVALRRHISTRSLAARYAPSDLVSRLQDSAENDLRFMLADAYRRGCDKLVIYGLVGPGSSRAFSGGRAHRRRPGRGL